MTNYIKYFGKKTSEQSCILPIQNVREYHFHDVAKNENFTNVKYKINIKYR